MPQANNKIVPLQIDGFRGRFDRRFAEAESMVRFVRALDVLAQEGDVLKDDVPSLVSCVRWNGQDVVIKRYNHQGLRHSLRHTLKGSRAKRNWHNAHRLLSLQIATPQPLAYVDRYRGPLLWQSYYVTRFVAGPQLCEVLRDESIADAEKQRINDQVLRLLDLMAEHGISHGDMKHTNILCDGTGLTLTDLDAMRIGGLSWLCRRRFQRDVERYRRDLRPVSGPSGPA